MGGCAWGALPCAVRPSPRRLRAAPVAQGHPPIRGEGISAVAKRVLAPPRSEGIVAISIYRCPVYGDIMGVVFQVRRGGEYALHGDSGPFTGALCPSWVVAALGVLQSCRLFPAQSPARSSYGSGRGLCGFPATVSLVAMRHSSFGIRHFAVRRRTTPTETARAAAMRARPMNGVSRGAAVAVRSAPVS